MWAEKFNRKVEKYGQSFVLWQQGNTTLCPGFNSETGYCDPQYHRDNPLSQACNEAGYVEGAPVKTLGKAMIQPIGANSLSDRGRDLEKVLSAVGKVHQDDHLYMGRSDIGLSSLKDSDYLEYSGRNFEVLNPDPIKIGDETVYVLALLRLRS